ncbi:MAG TPA: DUF1579 family protein [Phycisphaerae bacterium]
MPLLPTHAQTSETGCHARLKPLIGSWDVTIKLWPEPDAEPTEHKCSCENTWALDRRFLRQEKQGELYDRPYNGICMLGCDNVKNKFTLASFDNQHNIPQFYTGDCDSSGKTFTLTGAYDNPLTQRGETARVVLRIVGDNEHVSEMYVRAANGREFMTAQSTYHRRGSAAEGEPGLSGELVYTENSAQHGIKNSVTVSPRGNVTISDIAGRERSLVFSRDQMAELAAKLKDWKDWTINPLKNPPMVFEGSTYSISYSGKTLVWHDKTPDVPQQLKQLAEWLRSATASTNPPVKRIEKSMRALGSGPGGRSAPRPPPLPIKQLEIGTDGLKEAPMIGTGEVLRRDRVDLDGLLNVPQRAGS